MPGRALQVLLVEDSPKDAELILRELRRGGFDPAPERVETEEAMRSALASTERDLILADWSLPRFGALPALRHLKASGLDIPFIILSGTVNEEAAVEALRAGAGDFIVKSRMTRFLPAVERELREAASRRERRRMEEVRKQMETDLRRAYEELKSTQQQVIRQERLNALGQMASGIAHDFNNALMPVTAFSEILLTHPERLADREETLRLLRMIHTAGMDAANAVARLKGFYRTREADEVFLPVSLNRLVQETILLTQPKWEAQTQSLGMRIRVEQDPGEIPKVPGNEADLREALANLIFNAVDAMPQGGILTIRTRPADRGVLLEVADTGTGMTEEVRQRCLEPFFTTKGEKGTGLGLPMVYGILQRHGGTVEIDSEPGKGTTFRLLLPVSSAAQPGPPAPLPGAARPLRVLVVDDNDVSREVVVSCFRADGHAVEDFGDPLAAIGRFDPSRYDLVVTDLAMPGMAGDELARRVKARAPEFPVLCISGFGAWMAGGSLPEGVDAVVPKPVTPEGIRKALARVAPGTG